MLGRSRDARRSVRRTGAPDCGRMHTHCRGRREGACATRHTRAHTRCPRLLRARPRAARVAAGRAQRAGRASSPRSARRPRSQALSWWLLGGCWRACMRSERLFTRLHADEELFTVWTVAVELGPVRRPGHKAAVNRELRAVNGERERISAVNKRQVSELSDDRRSTIGRRLNGKSNVGLSQVRPAAAAGPPLRCPPARGAAEIRVIENISSRRDVTQRLSLRCHRTVTCQGAIAWLVPVTYSVLSAVNDSRSAFRFPFLPLPLTPPRGQSRRR